MSLKHLSDSDFPAFIEKGVNVVDFWATWCGPCRAFGPVFEAAAERMPGTGFGKYEITDENREAAGKYNVRSIPCIIAFKDGQVLDQKNGLMDEETFEYWIKGLAS